MDGWTKLPPLSPRKPSLLPLGFSFAMKPLRRSITFWTGLFVLVSLLWLLVDSYRMHSGLLIFIKDGTGGRQFSAGTQDGRFFLDTGLYRAGESHTTLYREPRQRSAPYQLQPRHFLVPSFIPDRLSVAIPYPLLILLHLGLWRFLMHRRRIRMQKAELTAPSLPSTGESPLAS